VFEETQKKKLQGRVAERSRAEEQRKKLEGAQPTANPACQVIVK